MARFFVLVFVLCFFQCEPVNLTTPSPSPTSAAVSGNLTNSLNSDTQANTNTTGGEPVNLTTPSPSPTSPAVSGNLTNSLNSDTQANTNTTGGNGSETKNQTENKTSPKPPLTTLHQHHPSTTAAGSSVIFMYLRIT
ncbi:protein CLEC16A homolog [Xyrauchen texanus]|uniref:protein CLEC16A homolog n=1 Tax=Xyrauchen texanus TaxID=154827 RepID=UPI002242B007|nr:protein CLEC16A homolog [Xyrauchen texanus]